MKKIRKIVALALATVMMMAMSITAFAEDATKTVTITNVTEGEAEVHYTQIVKADTTTETGWSFVNDDVAKVFVDSTEESDAQAVLKLLTSKDAKNTEVLRGEALKDAVDKIGVANMTTSASSTSFTVSAPGWYLVQLTSKDGMYNYNPAAIGVLSEDLTSEDALSLTAKKEPVKVSKDLTDKTNQKRVEINEEVGYTINTLVPYVYAGQENPTFVVRDQVSGAKFTVENGKVKVNVKVGDAAATTMDATYSTKVVDEETVECFELNLTSLLTKDNYLKPVVITYTATATSLEIDNVAYPVVNGHEPGDDYDYEHVTSFSGKVTLTKYDEKNNKLDGAKFLLYDATKANVANVVNGKLDSWVSVSSEGFNEEDFYLEAEDGELVVDGLDSDKDYIFVEKVAPEGYSVDTADYPVTWTNKTEAENVQVGEVTVHDTSLIRLPFTGGMGTTIFTVLGIAIMAMAAALYFATKKKATK